MEHAMKTIHMNPWSLLVLGDKLQPLQPLQPTSTAKERYAPLQNINLESDEEVDAWIRASSHSGR